MTNTAALKMIIEESKLRPGIFPKMLNITPQAFYNKLNGKTEFTASQMFILSDLLQLTPEKQRLIFFSQ